MGVLHTTNAVGSRVADGVVEELQVLANQVGARLGMLRVMAETQLQASTDGLTGLLNRRSFENKVRTLRSQATPFALVMGDLDHFKKLNDAHGHEAGDRALRLFAETLRTSLRPDDLVCRHGGEEFAIALPECSVGEAIEAMERVREELVPTLGRGDTPPFTASFGVTGSDLECDLEDLVRRADGALYRAKSQGRNRVVADDAPSERLLGPLFTRNGHDALGATSTTSEDP